MDSGDDGGGDWTRTFLTGLGLAKVVNGGGVADCGNDCRCFWKWSMLGRGCCGSGCRILSAKAEELTASVGSAAKDDAGNVEVDTAGSAAEAAGFLRNGLFVPKTASPAMMGAAQRRWGEWLS